MTPLKVPGVMADSGLLSSSGAVPPTTEGPLTPLAAAAPAVAFVTMARKAAVLGEGGGSGPEGCGVRPVPGVSPVRTKSEGLKAIACETSTDWPGLDAGCCLGPASMAGERGPFRREEMAGVEMFQLKGSSSPSGVVT